MRKSLVLPFVVGLAANAACSEPRVPAPPDLRASAEGFFSGVFGCEPDAIDRFAANEVAVSYPIFSTIFGNPVVRGREAVKQFSAGFCSRWADPELTVHESLQDGDRVVLVWGFSAIPTNTDSLSARPARESWGGISFFRFDESGLVIEEIGEESTPGPVARMYTSRGPG